jgi:hypothetical protein
MAGCERGRGTGGRAPVGVSLVLKAPVSLASASPIERSESLPVSAAVIASREEPDASWNEIDGVPGGFKEPSCRTSPAAGGLEAG